MNQINLDSLLHIGSTPASAASPAVLAPLKLSPDTLYQGLLNIGRDGSSQLQLSTAQGPVQIKLSPEQTRLLQAGLQQTSTTTLTTATIATQPQTSAHPQQPGQPQGLINLHLALKQLPSGQLQLQVQPNANPPTAVSFSSAALVKLLGAPEHSNQLQLEVQLSRSGEKLLLQLPNQRQLQLPLSFVPQSSQWPQQFQTKALLLLDASTTQLQIKLKLDTVLPEILKNSAAEVTKSPEQNSSSAQSKTGAGTTQLFSDSKAARSENAAAASTLPAAAFSDKTVSLSQAQNRELLPLLAKALQPALLSAETKPGADAKPLQQWLHNQLSAAQQATAKQIPTQLQQGADWQLSPSSHKSAPQQWQLQLSPTPPKGAVLELSPQQLNRTLLWQTTTADSQQKTQVDMSQLWRQWLPLSGAKADPLRVLPELPAALNAVFTELKAQSLDVAKPVQSSQLLTQLNAALQFNPLQQLPANTSSSAGTLAVALQLLLGRLAGASTTEPKTPVAAKLQQLIGQLDNTQSSNLLRQLSSHASTMQGSQLASVEQQQQPQQNQQLFIQLPLQQAGDSRFAELAISEREADGKSGNAKTRQWLLTMKFDLAELGPLLVQVRLTGQDVSLQFYAEQEKVVSTAQQFLPLFKDRLKLQGLSVSEAQCQLGKIPPQLYQRSNSLLAVKV
ncbi:flagellar hook-length control protein FliK [Rheinheimera sp.]|uniref:flagellar hook-length control protein FliK n=1 Tax=Rheinheimera sp. TaxID=1869214 RepID=UPI002FDD13AA